MLEKYFHNIFKSSELTLKLIEKITHFICSNLIKEDIDVLRVPFSKEGMKKALFDMGHTKAPGSLVFML